MLLARNVSKKHVCCVSIMQEEVTAEVNILLALKKQYKELTGEDFTPAQQTKKPDAAGKAAAEKSSAVETVKTIETAASDADVKLVKEQIEAQGQKVREMKATGATKVTYWQTYLTF